MGIYFKKRWKYYIYIYIALSLLKKQTINNDYHV